MIVPNHHQKRHLRAVIICWVLVLALALLAYGGWGLWQEYYATHTPHPTITKTVITSTAAPDETRPLQACASYKVAPDHPERLTIPSIGVDACIEQAGLTKGGAIATPDNIYTVAWYVNSVLPGQPGLSVIDGHISGYYRINAIFQYLDRLRAGYTFTVTLGSGRVLHYRVFKEQSVPLADAVQVLLTKEPHVTSQLNLITCGGQYDKAIGLYDRRIIVNAALVSS